MALDRSFTRNCQFAVIVSHSTDLAIIMFRSRQGLESYDCSPIDSSNDTECYAGMLVVSLIPCTDLLCK